jgi:hypothetical protein
MTQASLVQEHMDVISSDRKMVGKVDHLDGRDKIKLTKQSSPTGEHHHFIPLSWIDHVDQHVHLNKIRCGRHCALGARRTSLDLSHPGPEGAGFFSSYRTAQACLGRQKRRRPS